MYIYNDDFPEDRSPPRGLAAIAIKLSLNNHLPTLYVAQSVAVKAENV